MLNDKVGQVREMLELDDILMLEVAAEEFIDDKDDSSEAIIDVDDEILDNMMDIDDEMIADIDPDTLGEEEDDKNDDLYCDGEEECYE